MVVSCHNTTASQPRRLQLEHEHAQWKWVIWRRRFSCIGYKAWNEIGIWSRIVCKDLKEGGEFCLKVLSRYPPTSAEIKECMELCLHSPNTPPWRGAQLKNSGTTSSFTLLAWRDKGKPRPQVRIAGNPIGLQSIPTQPPNQCVPGALYLAVKRPGREADHSPPSSAEVKN
jgi:hypothetical protein